MGSLSPHSRTPGEARTRLEAGDALLLVDVQRDFCAGGALAVPDADAVVPVLNGWLAAAAEAGIPVFASRDWHPQGHPSFAAVGGPWPPHCVQDSPGAGFHPDLALAATARRVTKGVRFDRDQSSAFDETGLGTELRRLGVRRVWVAGLALDVCVRASVIDALRLGFEVHVIADATRPVDPEAAEDVFAELRRAGAVIESGA